MASHKGFSRRAILGTGLLGGVSALALAACGEAEVIEKTIVKEVPVERIVTVKEEVAVEVVKEVVKEVEVAADAGDFEVFSWWTNAGEVEGLNALFQVFQSRVPGINIINAAIAGGAGPGGNAKAVLQTRMLAGEPPDSFQIHWGHELTDEHVVSDRVENLDGLWDEEGLWDVFPESFVAASLYEGSVFAVPVNIHRGNVMWFDRAFFRDGGFPDPTTWDTWDTAFNVMDDIKAAGRTPFALGESVPFYTGHVFEDILASQMDADAYGGLFSGDTPWDGAAVTSSLGIMKTLIEEYSNQDYLSVDPGSAFEMALSGDAACTINGDWAEGFYRGKGYDGKYGWAPSPGTQGIYMALSDAFVVPHNATNREAALEWCRVCGSLDGQNQFNHFKGSIPVRTDANLSYFNTYQKEAIEDWNTNTVVQSIVHGFAARQSWITAFVNTLNVFAAELDIEDTQKTLGTDCEDAGVC